MKVEADEKGRKIVKRDGGENLRGTRRYGEETRDREKSDRV